MTFTAASSSYGEIYPVFIKHFTPPAHIAAWFQKQVKLKLSPGFQFECLCHSRQKETSKKAEELSCRSFTNLTPKLHQLVLSVSSVAASTAPVSICVIPPVPASIMQGGTASLEHFNSSMKSLLVTGV